MPKRRDTNAPYWQQLRLAERHIIEYALEHGQTIRKTAEILGISPNYLSERTRELGIPTPEVRPGPKPGTKPNRVAKPELRIVPDDSPTAPTRPVLPPSVRADTAEEEEDEEDTFDGDEDEEEEGDEDEEGDEGGGEEDEDEDEDDDADDDEEGTGDANQADQEDASETGN